MTLEEYLLDYASPEARALGEALIDAEMANEDLLGARAGSCRAREESYGHQRR